MNEVVHRTVTSPDSKVFSPSFEEKHDQDMMTETVSPRSTESLNLISQSDKELPIGGKLSFGDVRKMYEPIREQVKEKVGKIMNLGLPQSAISEIRHEVAEEKHIRINNSQRLEHVRQELEQHKKVLHGHEDFIIQQDKTMEHVETESKKDILTGIDNKKAFMEEFGIAVEKARLTGEPFYFLQYDINDLKLANTLGGHPHGDTLIKTAAQTVHASMRETDVSMYGNFDSNATARTGGDEIEGILFAETPEQLQTWYAHAQKKYNATQAVTQNKNDPTHPIEQSLSLGLGVVHFDIKEFEGKNNDEIYTELKNRSELPLEVAKKVAKNMKLAEELSRNPDLAKLIGDLPTKNAMFTPEQIEQYPELKQIAHQIEAEKKRQEEANMDSRKEAEEIVHIVKDNELSLSELTEAIEMFKKRKEALLSST